MHRFFHRLGPFIRGVVRHAGWVVTAALVLSGAAFYVAQNLRIDSDLSNLIPEEYPSVQALERLRAEVGAESDVAIAIVSPSFEANRRFAEELIPKALALRAAEGRDPYLTRVDYRRDTEFLRQNALYFATDAELDSLEAYLDDLGREASLEANPFFFDLEEDLEAEEDPAAGAPAADPRVARFEETYEKIVGKEYPVSDDSTTLVLRFYPAGSQTNIAFIESLYTDLDTLIAQMQPAAYHPEMEVTLAGRLLRQAVEIRAITEDVLGSFGVGVGAVLLAVMLYFLYKGYTARAGGTFSGRILLSELARMPILALIVGLPLLMSLTWTFGLAYLAFETLNLMTSTLGLVLFGLGIDYGIHFYARYTEERGRGLSVVDAAEVTFTSTGQAITVGALTTAAALYVLVVADFKGFSEFGFIAGTGILLALVSMTVVLPALLALFERFHLLNLEAATAKPDGAPASGRRYPAPRAIIAGNLVAVVVALVFLPRTSFEYRFGELEPEYEAYEARREVVRRVYGGGGANNPAYILVDDASEIQPIVEALREHAARDTLTPTIGSIETLQERFPATQEAQQTRLARIAAIRARLESPFLQAESSEQLARLREAAQTTGPLAIEQVPKVVRNQFTSKSGEIGRFIMVYPSVGVSDGRQSMAFSEDVGTVVTDEGKVYHAGSTQLVAADMLRLMLAEAPWMVLITLTLVAALMWLNFGSLRWAGLALLPLLVGILWMLLLMELFVLKLNFYNLVVLPAILGIGNDAGVHLVHRFREEGPGSILRVLRTTGEHVTIASLTTMIGFAGLMLSFHPGLRSIGQLAVAGIGATLLAALLFLPALIQWLEDRGLLKGRRPVAEAARP